MMELTIALFAVLGAASVLSVIIAGVRMWIALGSIHPEAE